MAFILPCFDIYGKGFICLVTPFIMAIWAADFAIIVYRIVQADVLAGLFKEVGLNVVHNYSFSYSWIALNISYTTCGTTAFP